MDARFMELFLAACVIAGCAGSALPPDPAYSRITVTPDRPDNPGSVRFEVPTGLVMGLPGDRVPITMQARIATREIAARELAAAGYCPNGFAAAEELVFPEGDRSRTAFVVRCL